MNTQLIPRLNIGPNLGAGWLGDAVFNSRISVPASLPRPLASRILNKNRWTFPWTSDGCFLINVLSKTSKAAWSFGDTGKPDGNGLAAGRNRSILMLAWSGAFYAFRRSCTKGVTPMLLEKLVEHSQQLDLPPAMYEGVEIRWYIDIDQDGKLLGFVPVTSAPQGS